MQSTVSTADKAGQIRAEKGTMGLASRRSLETWKRCSFSEVEVQKPDDGGFKNEWDERNLEAAGMNKSLRNSMNPWSFYFSLSYCEILQQQQQ